MLVTSILSFRMRYQSPFHTLRRFSSCSISEPLSRIPRDEVSQHQIFHQSDAGIQLTFCGVHSASVRTTPSRISKAANPAFRPVVCSSLNMAFFIFSLCTSSPWLLPSSPFSSASFWNRTGAGMTMAIGLFLSAAA